MKIVAISVGSPREVRVGRQVVRTSIFKSEVAGPVAVRRLNLDGDQQSDLSVHGGVDKAVYVYPSEHYPFWRGELGPVSLRWGAFGENLTTEGLLESATCIGDTFEIGSAAFVVTQPRLPCFKLGIRFEREDIVKRFMETGRTGFYLRVAREGEVSAGDPITVSARGVGAVTVAEILDLYTAAGAEPDLLRRASQLPALSDGWREHFRNRLREAAE